MRVSTIAMFVVAFLCAGAAAFLVRGMIAGQNDSPAAAVAAVRPASKTVIVAARDLKPGDKLTEDSLGELILAESTLPQGVFTAKSALLKAGEERFVTVLIAKNEPILPSKLTGLGDSALAGRMRQGMSGVTIRVNEASSVGGFAQPEDRVDVLWTRSDRPGESGESNKAYILTLLRNVRVLAVDQQTQRKLQAQPPKTVTLEVSAENAKKLTLAGSNGQLSLTLTRDGKEGAEPDVIDINDLMRQVPQTTQAPVNAPQSLIIDPVVTITRSVERKEYKVPSDTKR